MKLHSRSISLGLSILVIAMVLAASLPVAAEPLAVAAKRISDEAARGNFESVLTSLKSADDAEADAPAVRDLIADLEAHQQKQIKRTEERRAAYNEAMDEVAKFLAEDNLDKALSSAIQAHDLAFDVDKMLDTPVFDQLVKQAIETRDAAEARGDWVEVLTISRTLELLYGQRRPKYREQTEAARTHIRVLQRYAPEELKRLYAERAKRQGIEDPEPLDFGQETWKEKLEGVQRSQLHMALRHAARFHIANDGYRTLLQGAIEELNTFLATKGVEQTFDSLQDERTVERFRNYLQTMSRLIDEQEEKPSLFDAVTYIHRILDYNERTLKLPEQLMIHEMAEGAMGALDDFSSVIWPHDLDQFKRTMQGEFSGVGIQISRRFDAERGLYELLVVTPLPDTPAYRAGIRAGDIIARVDGTNTAGWSLDEAVRRITGPEGTTVRLTIERQVEEDVVETIQYPIRRQRIPIDSVRGWQRQEDGAWDYYLDRERRIGYIRLSQFLKQTADDLDAAVEQMRNDAGLDALVLDLRLNPGGLLDAAWKVSDRFILGGDIVATVDMSGEPTDRPYRARRQGTYPDIPVVVLINEHSASASEIVAGALQDHGRATIVGTRSYGKGSVQNLFKIDGENALLKLTTQYYQLPNGRIIHRKPGAEKWGVEPDLKVEMTEQQIADLFELRQKVDIVHQEDEQLEEGEQPKADEIMEQGLDPQLESALLLLKTRLVADHITVARSR